LAALHGVDKAMYQIAPKTHAAARAAITLR